ncbi:MAG: alpha/beta hydrolase [Clostridia bacterium]|nr:alpha/beta hydrolase [Clostridia bacterium]
MISFPRFVFKIVDIAFDKAQNGKSYGEVVSKKDISYDDTIERCKLDIYCKEFDNTRKRPIIVNFHGGGFLAGDKKHRRGIANYFINKIGDIFVVNPNYRLCEKDTFPAFAQDAAKALKWVEDNAEEYGFDLTKVLLCGDSAGAHIASQQITIMLNEGLGEKLGCVKNNIKIKGAFLNCGPYDTRSALTQKVLLGMAHKIGKKVTGVNCKDLNAVEKYEYINELAPINWITSDFPVCFFAHTKADFFCPEHGRVMIDKLAKLGVKSYEYYSTEKNDIHCWNLTQSSKSGQKCMEKVVEYYKSII